MRQPIFIILLVLLTFAPFVHAGAAEKSREVGRIATDWIGNDIVLRALPDPKIQGITCHLTSFERGAMSRISGMFNGLNPFEDPSNTSISCRQTGPIVIKDIKFTDKGEDIFSERISLVFKQIGVRRFYDSCNDTLVYVSYGKRVIEGTAKQDVSNIPLYNQAVTWEGTAKPACDAKD